MLDKESNPVTDIIKNKKNIAREKNFYYGTEPIHSN